MPRLSQYFQGVAAKHLSAVEANPEISNQHELNGTRDLADLFGRARLKMDCLYLYLGEEEDQTERAAGFITWYDARENHPTRTEYRLYYENNSVMELASEGDLVIVGKRADGSALCLVARQGSTFESQVLWLFGITNVEDRFILNNIEGEANREVGYAERTILETLGIEVNSETPGLLDMILEKFGETFPKTRIFSSFARETIPEISSIDDPDIAILKWVNQEELLFKTLERHIVEEKLRQRFDDVDSFISFSLSVHNRRKSRMGYALENHLEQIFIDRELNYSHEKVTENKKKPDFIFPGITQYHSPTFPVQSLTMLGVKSTCKDRWRQVLSEANKITNKHLFTLEPGISLNQTTEMRSSELQLVLPEGLHETYNNDQQEWLVNLSEFLDMVEAKQNT